MNLNRLLRYFIGLLILIMLYSCEKDEAPVVVEVDARLQFYFDRFAEEGATRGVIVDYDSIKISGKIENIDNTSRVAGQCQSNSIDPNVIVVDLNFWNGSNEIEREFVIYHELGHCYLDRDHLDEANDDGTCVSIMHSGTGDCTNVFNSTTKRALLDELFNP